MGSTSDPETVELLFRQGKKWIANHVHGEDLFEQTTAQAEEEELVENLLSNVENILINGTELILNRIYDRVGFNQIEDDILRYLSIARLSQPLSIQQGKRSKSLGKDFKSGKITKDQVNKRGYNKFLNI